ncbi:hypothetical protein [Peribacillus sp. SCS-155]
MMKSNQSLYSFIDIGESEVNHEKLQEYLIVFEKRLKKDQQS